MENKYFFKVSDWKYPTKYFWIPPVQAATYQAALVKVYNDETIVSADLKFIETWGGITKIGRDLFTPSTWDVRL